MRTLTSFQRGAIQQGAIADQNEEMLRQWLVKMKAHGHMATIAEELNARMSELVTPVASGDTSIRAIVDQAIAIAAGMQFARLQQEIAFAEPEGGGVEWAGGTRGHRSPIRSPRVAERTGGLSAGGAGVR